MIDKGSNVKNQILPMNMNDMMAIEEDKLLKLVDPGTKKRFMENKVILNQCRLHKNRIMRL